MKLNTALLEELETGNGEFCTAAVVRIRPHDEGVRLTVAVAGHPLPLILRANGDVEEAGTPGTVLGVFEEIEVSDTIEDLHAGDALVMLTDGVLEAGRDPDWESKVIPRLLALVHGAVAGRDRRPHQGGGCRSRRSADGRRRRPGVEGASLGGRNRRLLGRHRRIGHRRWRHRLRGRVRWRRRRYRCRTGAGRGLGVRSFRPEAAGWRCSSERTRAHGRPPRSVGSCWRALTPVGTALHPSWVGEVDQTVGNVNVTMELARSSTNVTSGASASINVRRYVASTPSPWASPSGEAGRHDGRAHPIRVRHDLDGDPPTAPSLDRLGADLCQRQPQGVRGLVVEFERSCHATGEQSRGEDVRRVQTGSRATIAERMPPR